MSRYPSNPDVKLRAHLDRLRAARHAGSPARQPSTPEFGSWGWSAPYSHMHTHIQTHPPPCNRHQPTSPSKKSMKTAALFLALIGACSAFVVPSAGRNAGLTRMQVGR